MSLRSYAIRKALRGLSAIYERRLSRYPDLRDLIERLQSPSSGDRSTGVEVADYIALYEHIRERKPRHILELGAGRSSAAIALAAPAGSEFIAVEESQQWLENHRRVIPADLQERIELIQRDPEARDLEGVRCAYYRDLPLRPYEFVHVDGPNQAKQDARVSCDIIDLAPHLGERCLIVFDGREDSARLARPYLEHVGFRTRRHPFTRSYEFVR